MPCWQHRDARDASGKMRGAKATREVVSGVDLQHVADLAMLKIAPADEEKMLKDLLEVVEFANQLEKIDTTGIAPMAHIAPMENVWRADVVTNTNQRDLLLENAPAKEDGCIFVPQVVE